MNYEKKETENEMTPEGTSITVTLTVALHATSGA